ncbi:MAG: hypothetical protein U0M51_05470, partial [Eggerthellaceae bacterium]
ELITRGDANEGIDAHPALYENVVGRAVNQIPGIGYFVMALASLPGKLVLGWVVLMGAAFSIIGTAIADYFRFSAAPISYRATRDFNTGRIASDPTISS